jgi:4-diphosphocytidyl-2-C-methyl-D-erythritol kinase
MSGNRTFIVSAPAKINLGLEILGKRDDGYHEIRTILATINLADTIRLTIVPNQIETRITGRACSVLIT